MFCELVENWCLDVGSERVEGLDHPPSGPEYPFLLPAPQIHLNLMSRSL